MLTRHDANSYVQKFEKLNEINSQPYCLTPQVSPNKPRFKMRFEQTAQYYYKDKDPNFRK